MTSEPRAESVTPKLQQTRSTAASAQLESTLPPWQMLHWVLFFFQAEDGIRDLTVTGVQTCALPISPLQNRTVIEFSIPPRAVWHTGAMQRLMLGDFELTAFSDGTYSLDGGAFFGVVPKIGRASCRERV